MQLYSNALTQMALEQNIHLFSVIYLVTADELWSYSDVCCYSAMREPHDVLHKGLFGIYTNGKYAAVCRA
jgi:hypothetical protein